jgi:hypothetical protein
MTVENEMHEAAVILAGAGLRKIATKITFLERGEVPKILIGEKKYYPPEFTIDASVDTRSYVDVVNALIEEELKVLKNFSAFDLATHEVYITLRPESVQKDAYNFSIIPTDGARGNKILKGLFATEYITIVMVPKENTDLIAHFAGENKEVVTQKISLEK